MIPSKQRRVTASIIITTLILSTTSIILCCNAQRQDPSQFNGGSILAMSGHNSVAIAIDSRFGLGFQTISTGTHATTHYHDDDNIITVDDKDEEVARDDGRAGGGSSSIIGEGNPRIIQLPNSNTLLAWTGLYGDGISFAEEMNILLGRKVRKAGCMGFPTTTGVPNSRRSMKKMMSPRAITMLMSHLLYRRRNAPYYVEPVVVGLETVCIPITSSLDTLEVTAVEEEAGAKSKDETLQALITSGTDTLISPSTQQIIQQQQILSKTISYKTIQRPYLCGTDMLGAQSTSNSFVCAGVASRSLHGTAEALWRPNLDGEELVQVCGKAFVSALERDILSGYGAVVYLIQGGYGEDGMGVRIVEYVLACRND